jgi:hypothetical protein
MTFNLQAALVDERFRAVIAPKLLLRQWLTYQLRRTRIAYLPAYRRCSARKPLFRCLLEAGLLALRWRCLPFHYLRYGLYERTYSLPEALTYLPETAFYYRLLSTVNRDVLLLDDKVVCKRILGDAGIPQPRLLLSGDSVEGYDHAGTPIPIDSDAVLADQFTDGQVVVIKPARYSSGGDGVIVLTYERGRLRGSNGAPVSLAEYGRIWGLWLIEEFVRQHDRLAALNRECLNTFRVITIRPPRHSAEARYCILKLGSSTGPVDNAHDGGLYVGVDKHTGLLHGTAFDETFTRHTQHPTSGVTFDGYRIDAIGDVVALAERSAALFPQTTVIGWDIAVTDDGPQVIEGNSSPGLTNVQRTHGGVAPTLGRTLRKARADR